MKQLLRRALVAMLLALLAACGAAAPTPTATLAQPSATLVAASATAPPPSPTAEVAPTPSLEPTQASVATPYPEPTSASAIEEPPVYTFRVVKSYPHDPAAFTQGLDFDEQGALYEGTGLNGQSGIRRVNLETGEVLQSAAIEQEHFGEGIVVLDDRIIELTWLSHKAFVWDKQSFERIGEFDYPTEGWGLTHDGQRLIMSDGTATIYFRDPATFEELGTITVTDPNGPIASLNELEYVEGEIYANIWQTDRIARISPETGEVLGWIDLTGIIDRASQPMDVLNGIAYDERSGRLFVTGKLWPRMFEIELVEQP